MTNMDSDQDSLQFWSTLLQSLSDSNPRDDLCPAISSPLLVMSTSMATVVPPPQPSYYPGDGGMSELGKAIATTGGKDVNEGGQRSTGKQIVVEKNEGAKEEIKTLGKRTRTNEARNNTEKRRRNDIRNKLEKLKELIPNCNQRDVASSLDCIIDHIRWMKSYVESRSMGPMLPLGMNMDFPAPWFPYYPPVPNYVMPPFNGYFPGGTTGDNQQIGHVTPTTKDFNK